MKHHRRRDRQTAKLLSVSEEIVGTTLSADAASGATTLSVDDVSVFDESGWLMVGTQTIQYTAIDDDAGTVTLATALTSAADTDDPVYRYSKLYSDVETVLSAQVAVLGDRDQADELTVEVADWLDVPTGDRGGDGENCVIESDGDVWTLISAPGRPSKARGVRFESYEPPYAPTDAEMAAGTFTHQLLHRNIAAQHGLFTTVNGVALDAEWWSLNAATGQVTVTIPTWMSGLAAADRVFDWPMYAYRGALAADIPEVTPPPAPAPVNFTVVGSLGDHNQPSTSSTAFPAGTTTGDLFIYACITRNGYTNLCPDSRAALWVNSTKGIYYTVKVWVGTVTSPATPLSISNTGSSGNFETSWRLMVIRPASTVTFDASKISDSGVRAGSTGSIPGLTGVSGAVGVGFSTKATSASIHNWPSPWTGSGSTTGTYNMVSIAAQVNTTVGSTAAISPDEWRGFDLGVGLG